MVRGLIPALVQQGMECEIATTVGYRVGADTTLVPNVPVHRFNTGWASRIWTAHSGQLAEFLHSEMRRFDLIHIHELWHYGGLAASRVARKLGIPYVVTIHGALEEWTLSHKPLRKYIYMKMVQNRILNSAAALHAITESEAVRVSSLGYDVSIFTVPNGVPYQLPSDFRHKDTSDFLVRYPQLNGKRVILYMGRLHAIKGMDILARSFAGVARRFEDAMMLIAGPDEDGTRRRIEETLDMSGLLDRAVFTGMLTGEDWYAAFRCADVFVLPSYSEGFSIAILEGLAAGLPAVISDQCNFPEVEQSGAGLVVSPDDTSFAKALTALLSDKALTDRMGENGLRMIKERYNWTAIAQSIAKAYESILEPTGTSSPPRPERQIV